MPWCYCGLCSLFCRCHSRLGTIEVPFQPLGSYWDMTAHLVLRIRLRIIHMHNFGLCMCIRDLISRGFPSWSITLYAYPCIYKIFSLKHSRRHQYFLWELFAEHPTALSCTLHFHHIQVVKFSLFEKLVGLRPNELKLSQPLQWQSNI